MSRFTGLFAGALDAGGVKGYSEEDEQFHQLRAKWGNEISKKWLSDRGLKIRSMLNPKKPALDSLFEVEVVRPDGKSTLHGIEASSAEEAIRIVKNRTNERDRPAGTKFKVK